MRPAPLFAPPPRGPRHRYRPAEPGELREYGSALKARDVCTTCGIFRFQTDHGRESVTYYARVYTPKNGRGRSEILKRWERAPACPPGEDT